MPRADTPEERFEAKIRPILAKNCFACHTASKMGGLAMTSRERIANGWQVRAGVVPGKPDESRLILAVRQGDAVIKPMPMTGKLKPDEIAALEEWVRDGAVWPVAAKVQPSVGRISAEQRAFWSFQPVRKTAPPAVPEGEWSRQPVDRFIYANFASADSNRLLAPPRDMAAARDVRPDRAAADARGGGCISPRQVGACRGKGRGPAARVAALRRALGAPLAGCGALLRRPAGVAEGTAAPECVPLSRLGDRGIQQRHAVQRVRARADRRAICCRSPQRTKLLPGLTFYGLSPEQQDERVDATTRGFLGLTVACAQCHDHKFDPIPQTDFYALQGVFNSTEIDEIPLAPEAEVVGVEGP